MAAQAFRGSSLTQGQLTVGSNSRCDNEVTGGLVGNEVRSPNGCRNGGVAGFAAHHHLRLVILVVSGLQRSRRDRRRGKEDREEDRGDRQLHIGGLSVAKSGQVGRKSDYGRLATETKGKENVG